MRARSAAPEAAVVADLGSDGINQGNADTIPLSRLGLPSVIVARLSANNIVTAADWLTLSHKRRANIWGVTRRHCADITAALAKAVRP
jgi:hypothetical protein